MDIVKIENGDHYVVNDDGDIIAGPFSCKEEGRGGSIMKEFQKLATVVQDWTNDRDQDFFKSSQDGPIIVASYVLWALGELTAAILREVSTQNGETTETRPGPSQKSRRRTHS